MQTAVPIVEKTLEKKLLATDSDTCFDLSVDDTRHFFPEKRRNIDDIFDAMGERRD